MKREVEAVWEGELEEVNARVRWMGVQEIVVGDGVVRGEVVRL